MQVIQTVTLGTQSGEVAAQYQAGLKLLTDKVGELWSRGPLDPVEVMATAVVLERQAPSVFAELALEQAASYFDLVYQGGQTSMTYVEFLQAIQQLAVSMQAAPRMIQ